MDIEVLNNLTPEVLKRKHSCLFKALPLQYSFNLMMKVLLIVDFNEVSVRILVAVIKWLKFISVAVICVVYWTCMKEQVFKAFNLVPKSRLIFNT